MGAAMNKRENRRGQEQKSEILVAMPKKAQEEMIGFGLIIALVAIIILVFLWFSLSGSKKETLNSYEIESFVQATLQYTSECQNSRGNFLPVDDLIFSCYKGESCANTGNSCQILDLTLKSLLYESWKTGSDRPIKGYEMNITVNGESVFSIKEGNSSQEYKGTLHNLPKRGTASIMFKAYY
jgi:hypothetical protein